MAEMIVVLVPVCRTGKRHPRIAFVVVVDVVRRCCRWLLELKIVVPVL
jgi:hypothetical protein